MQTAVLQKEASEVFFSVTKLFQNRDANLRRMVYLVIKDVCPSADEVIIITSSLMKDMNSKTDLYRSNAIRVLCSITDTQLLAQIERSVPSCHHTYCCHDQHQVNPSYFDNLDASRNHHDLSSDSPVPAVHLVKSM